MKNYNRLFLAIGIISLTAVALAYYYKAPVFGDSTIKKLDVMTISGSNVVPRTAGLTLGSTSFDGAFDDITINGTCTGGGCGSGGGGSIATGTLGAFPYYAGTSASLTVLATSSLFTASDNIGMGTTTPAYKLEVIGTGRFSGALSLGTGLGIDGGDTINLNQSDSYWDISRLSSPTGAQLVTSAAVNIDVYGASNQGFMIRNHSNTSLFEVEGTGNARIAGNLTTVGAVTGSNLNISSWDTAYGWGNHAGLYDTLGQATGTLAIHTSTYNHANYNTAYGWGNHASAGYLTVSTFLASSTLAHITSLPGLATVGTIGTGVWNGTAIDVAHGGTGSTTLTGILKGNTTSAVATAVKGTDYGVIPRTWPIASSTLASFGTLSATTTIEWGFPTDTETFKTVTCSTDVGSALVTVANGIATTTFACSVAGTTNSSPALSFTTTGKRKLLVGSLVSSPNIITLSWSEY